VRKIKIQSYFGLCLNDFYIKKCLNQLKMNNQIKVGINLHISLISYFLQSLNHILNNRLTNLCNFFSTLSLIIIIFSKALLS